MKNPLVVGYKGEIGSFILQGLLKVMPKAGNIWCYDINDSLKEKRERIKKSDVIFLCVPIELTNAWFDIFHKELKGKTVIEQTSLKYLLYNWRNFKHVTKDINLLSMHILFRPSGTPDHRDRWIALIGKGWDVKLESLLLSMFNSSICVYDNWKDHDKEMAFQQTLVHKVINILGDCLEKRNKSGHTYTSKQVIQLSNRIKQIDPKLYKIIQGSKYKDFALNKFKKELNKRI